MSFDPTIFVTGIPLSEINSARKQTFNVAMRKKLSNDTYSAFDRAEYGASGVEVRSGAGKFLCPTVQP